MVVRAEMVASYGEDLQGMCIEASDRIVERIRDGLGVEAVAVEGWCRFDNEYYGSDRPWDPHTWVEVPSLNLYIDVTADQFNYGMYKENDFPAVIVHKGLPHGMFYEEPTWDEYEEDVHMMDCVDDLIEYASEEAAVRAFRLCNPGLTLATSGWDGFRVTFRNTVDGSGGRVFLPFLPENYRGEKDGFSLTIRERQIAYEELEMYGVAIENFVIESAEMFQWPFKVEREKMSSPGEAGKAAPAAGAGEKPVAGVEKQQVFSGSSGKVSDWLAAHSLEGADDTFAWASKKKEDSREL